MKLTDSISFLNGIRDPMHYLFEGFSNIYESLKQMSKPSTMTSFFKQQRLNCLCRPKVIQIINVLESCNILMLLTIRLEGSSYACISYWCHSFAIGKLLNIYKYKIRYVMF